MGLDYDHLMNYDIPEVEQTYTGRDTMLYALGVGLCMDPLDREALRFTYEKELRALPTMCCVLGTPGSWISKPDTGIDYLKVLHGEMGFRIHQPIPTAAKLRAKTRVTDIFDKGADVGALVVQSREIVDAESGQKIATTTSTTFARGNGGFGGARGPSSPKHIPGDRAADAVCDLPTLPQAALIYRLSGDYNPLHSDPDVAEKAGFKAPILHGLCTYGVVGHALLKTLCDYQPDRFQAMSARFSSPVYPGETIRTEMWQLGDGKVAFRGSIPARDNLVVLNEGLAEISA
jgi:acyl dehydratase